jgi:flagellin
MNVLDGSLGSTSFQVGANVGQSISLNLSQSMSAASIGGGVPAAGNTLGSFSVSLDNTGAAAAAPGITSITASWDSSKNAVSYTDQNGNAITDASTISYYTATTGGTIPAAAGDPSDTLTVAANANATITQINVLADGNGGFTLTDQNGQALNVTAATNIFASATTAPATDANGNTTMSGETGAQMVADIEAVTDAGVTADANVVAADKVTAAVGTTIDKLTTSSSVSQIDISTKDGASAAMLTIDNALSAVNNLQATLGAAQNRFTAISTTQQAQSTDLSSAQSSIQDADFAQETANLSKAQVLQQAGISVLSQANSQPQQILKLLQ